MDGFLFALVYAYNTWTCSAPLNMLTTSFR